MKIKINIRSSKTDKDLVKEAQTTMPPLGREPAQSTMPFGDAKPPETAKKQPKAPPSPKPIDRKAHYQKHSKAVLSIVNNWFNKNVVEKQDYPIDSIISRIEKDRTLLNRLDKSVDDGFISDRTRKTIMKIHMGDQMVIDRLKKEVSEKTGDQNDNFDWVERTPEEYKVDSGVSTIPDPIDEAIILDVLPHLMKYLHLFANESWYNLTGSAASAALVGTYSMKRRDLVEAALGKYIKYGWTPLQSSISKAKWMKDYDLEQKWPEKVYDLRENSRKIKVKIT